VKILLIGNYPANRQESMQRFSALLFRELTARGLDVQLLLPRVLLGHLGGSVAPLKKWLGYIDFLVIFFIRLVLKKTDADLIHICDQGNAFYSAAFRRKPVLVTCHDVLAIRSALEQLPVNPVGASGKLFQKLIVLGLRHADAIACVSEQTRLELKDNVSGLRAEPLLVENCFNYPYTPDSSENCERQLARFGLQRNGYLLHVGGNQWYKNRLGVLKIFRELALQRPHIKLVLVGKALAAESSAYIEEHRLTQKVISIQGADNSTLASLYTGAIALLFPSLAEGFGWPIIEAQACGCPVFTSNRPPMNQIGGSAARYLPPDEPEKAAEIVLNSMDELAGLRVQGLVNSQRFSTTNMMATYIALYQRLAATA
jgi:glycosyltransferase involved in cell wall biosynthesis